MSRTKTAAAKAAPPPPATAEPDADLGRAVAAALYARGPRPGERVFDVIPTRSAPDGSPIEVLAVCTRVAGGALRLDWRGLYRRAVRGPADPMTGRSPVIGYADGWSIARGPMAPAGRGPAERIADAVADAVEAMGDVPVTAADHADRIRALAADEGPVAALRALAVVPAALAADVSAALADDHPLA